MRAAAVAICAAAIAGCASPTIFEDEGVLDAGTRLFTLERGTYTVEYRVSDWDPMLGCDFSIRLARQPADDALAPGIDASPVTRVRVDARGDVSGIVNWPVIEPGSHFLQIGGGCRWHVMIRRA